jgi:predicted O-methyltransferase YrrM
VSRETIGLGDKLMAYVREVGAREDADMRRLREETAKHPRAQMQISLEQGQFLALLIELIGAKRTLEVGTFTGYSAMWVAKAMGPAGRVVALDVDKDFTAVAQRHWKQAGVDGQIDLRLAPAAESLQKMLDAGEAGAYDFAFIDADKPNYDTYYEYAIKLLRQGGVIAIDNVLWSGRVADPTERDEETAALRALNAKIAKDERVTVSMVPIGDGLTLARKR